MLTKESILAADDLPREKVIVPEWRDEVWVKTLNGEERDSYEASILQDGKVSLDNIRAKLCVRCMVDDQGNRLFEDKDAFALGRKSGNAIRRVFEVAQRLNKMGEEDLKELQKNSGRGPTAGG
jgi:hypothetical protein